MIENSTRIECLAEFHQLVKSDIKAKLQATAFDYIDFDTAEVLHAISVGLEGWVAVIGNPSDGAYEWIWRVEGHSKRILSSNQGWGCAASAMRDGLSAAMED